MVPSETSLIQLVYSDPLSLSLSDEFSLSLPDKLSLAQSDCTSSSVYIFVGELESKELWSEDPCEDRLNGTLPSDPQRAKYMKARDAWFVYWQGQLYKKSFSHPLLKCVTPEKGAEILEDLHEGFCGSHIGGRSLAWKGTQNWLLLAKYQTRCHQQGEEV